MRVRNRGLRQSGHFLFRHKIDVGRPELGVAEETRLFLFLEMIAVITGAQW